LIAGDRSGATTEIKYTVKRTWGWVLRPYASLEIRIILAVSFCGWSVGALSRVGGGTSLNNARVIEVSITSGDVS